MGTRSGLSPSTIGRIWRQFEPKPHVQDFFKLSTDPQFVNKVVAVVGSTTILPSWRWCCAWTRNPGCSPGPLAAGDVIDVGHSAAAYPRRCALFASFNIIDGNVISALHRQHRAVQFRKFPFAIDRLSPPTWMCL